MEHVKLSRANLLSVLDNMKKVIKQDSIIESHRMLNILGSDKDILFSVTGNYGIDIQAGVRINNEFNCKFSVDFLSFYKLLKSMTVEKIELEFRSGKLLLKGNGRYSIPASDEYLGYPGEAKTDYICDVEYGKFRKMIEKTKSVVAPAQVLKYDTRPHLLFARIRFDGAIESTTASKTTIGIYGVKLDGEISSDDVMIERGVYNFIGGLSGIPDNSIMTIRRTHNKLILVFLKENIEVMVTLGAGEFPAMDFLDNDYKFITVDVAKLRESLLRIQAIIIGDNGNLSVNLRPITVAIKDRFMTMSYDGGNNYNASESLEIKNGFDFTFYTYPEVFLVPLVNVGHGDISLGLFGNDANTIMEITGNNDDMVYHRQYFIGASGPGESDHE